MLNAYLYRTASEDDAQIHDAKLTEPPSPLLKYALQLLAHGCPENAPERLAALYYLVKLRH